MNSRVNTGSIHGCDSPSAKNIAGYLGSRPIEAVETKQALLHWARRFPKRIRISAAKMLWPTPIRHMRYVVPSVDFLPRPAAWKIRLRGDPAFDVGSLPLANLRGHATRPAVIVATGPSANQFDWQALKDGNHQIWAVSGAPTLLAKHGLRCDFLVVSDHRFGRDGADHIALAVEQGATLLFTHEAAAGFAATRPQVLAKARFHIFEKVNRWYGIPALDAADLISANEKSGRPFLLPDPPVPGVGWSSDPMLGVFAGKTVTFAALQLAVWAGSPSIEIVGMDLGGVGRAYHEERPEVSHLEKDYARVILPAFECMAAALAGSPLHIVNHSPTCPLSKELFNWTRPAT